MKNFYEVEKKNPYDSVYYESSEIRTVGALRKLLAQFDEDMTLNLYDSQDSGNDGDVSIELWLEDDGFSKPYLNLGIKVEDNPDWRK